MNNFQRLIYDLEDYARQQGGRFWLLDTNKYTDRPPQGQLWIVVDFDKGAVPATIYVDIACKKHGIPYRLNQAADLGHELKSVVLPNAMILFGAPWDRDRNLLEATDHFRKQFPALISADLEIHIRYGWIGILQDFLRQVRKIGGDKSGFELRDVRQKYGMLEIEWRSALSKTDGIYIKIDEASVLATERSRQTCEFCARPGHQRVGDAGTIIVACEIHGGDSNG